MKSQMIFEGRKVRISWKVEEEENKRE